MLVRLGAVDCRRTIRAGSTTWSERLGHHQGSARKGNPGAPLGYMDHQQRFRVACRQGHKCRAGPSTPSPPTRWYPPLDYAYRSVIIIYAVLIVPCCQGLISTVLTVYLRVPGPGSCELSRLLSSTALVSSSVCDSLLPLRVS